MSPVAILAQEAKSLEMSILSIKNGINGNILFTINKSISIIEQFKDNLGSQQYNEDAPNQTFIPLIHRLIFLVDGDTISYSIHDLSTLDTDVVFMIYVPLSKFETKLYYEFVLIELKKYKPLLPIKFKYYNDEIYTTDIFDFNNTCVKKKFEQYYNPDAENDRYILDETFEEFYDPNFYHVRYILDGTNVELNKYQCKYEACKCKSSLQLETPILFHIKFYYGPDLDRRTPKLGKDELIWLNYMQQLLESNGYVLYSPTCYGPTFDNKLNWVRFNSHWILENKVPKFFIRDNNTYLGHEKFFKIIEEVEMQIYDIEFGNREIVDQEILTEIEKIDFVNIEKNDITKFFFI